MNTDPELVQSAVETLRQGERMLTDISDEAYVRKIDVAFSASIGGHYRHCLDHFRALLEAAPAGDLNYDQRERGTLVEKDRFAALNATRELCAGYEKLDAALLARQLKITCKSSYGTDESQVSPSTVGREVMYVVAHAVHHYALIGVISRVTGLRLAGGFGVAPSTLKYQAQATKAA
ncbi:MAG: DinB family protein [Verrucomicrobiota bacterium]|jgi:uncharacterized damage-inducible protein DinB